MKHTFFNYGAFNYLCHFTQPKMDCAKLPTAEIRDAMINDETEIVSFFTVYGEEFQTYATREFVETNLKRAGAFVLDNGKLTFVQGWKIDLSDVRIYANDDNDMPATITGVRLIDIHNKNKVVSTLSSKGDTLKAAMTCLYEQLTMVLEEHLVDKHKGHAAAIAEKPLRDSWSKMLES